MKTVRFGLAAALVAAAAMRAHAQEDAVVPSPGEVEFVVVADEIAVHDKYTDKDGEYWLGVQLAMLPEVAKKQLGVEHGLAVEEVAPDSPAAKAEIKRFDILVKADETALKNPADLIKSLDASQGKELTLVLVREGKDRTVKVVATKRPETARFDVRMRHPEFAEEIKRLEEALAHLKAKAGNKGVDLLFARPAIVAPKAEMNRALSYRIGEGKSPEFPSDLSVQINKKSDQPAQIHVKRGDKEWNITEKEIDQLPEDIRPHVLHYLGRGPVWGGGHLTFDNRPVRVNPEGRVEGEIRIPPLPPRPPVPARAPAAATRTRPVPPAAPAMAERRIIEQHRAIDDGQNQKLDAILKKLNSIERLESEMKELRKELEDVRGKR